MIIELHIIINSIIIIKPNVKCSNYQIITCYKRFREEKVDYCIITTF